MHETFQNYFKLFNTFSLLSQCFFPPNLIWIVRQSEITGISFRLWLFSIVKIGKFMNPSWNEWSISLLQLFSIDSIRKKNGRARRRCCIWVCKLNSNFMRMQNNYYEPRQFILYIIIVLELSITWYKFLLVFLANEFAHGYVFMDRAWKCTHCHNALWELLYQFSSKKNQTNAYHFKFV